MLIQYRFISFVISKGDILKYRDLNLQFSINCINFTILSICLEKLTRPIPKHSHSKSSYELHYISYGYGTLIADGTEYRITPGTLFMTGPGIAHEQVSLASDPMTEYCIYFQIETSGKNKKIPFVQSFLKHLFWLGAADQSIHELMKQIFAELEAPNPDSELMLQALLQQLLLLVVRHYEHDDIRENALVPNATSKNDLTYLIIEEAFLYDYRDLTLDTLAKQVNLGKRQTERLLQKHYNKTFLQKRTEARMSAACLLLSESNKSIAEIADELGYSSAEHFTNTFRQFYGMTPSGYRKRK